MKKQVSHRELSFKIKEKSTGKFTEDFNLMMNDSGLDSRIGFEDIGIQSNGTPVIFDRCGNFAYLSDKYEMVIISDT